MALRLPRHVRRTLLVHQRHPTGQRDSIRDPTGSARASLGLAAPGDASGKLLEAQPFTSSSVPEGERDKQQVVVALKDHHEPVNGVDTAPTGCDTPPDVQPPVSVTESGDECMDVSRDEGSPMAAKRSHERTVNSEP
ncbi:hypothetical protein HPB50_028721 [Hyalomma asiaticum]|nr:hypothetical protein HPB50_028721 [Hyalomma asiaticum]